VGADFVADAARPRVQRQPDGALRILGQLDEVIAAAERAECEAPVLVVLIGVEALGQGERFEAANPRRGCRSELRVVLAGAHRNAPLDALADAPQVWDVVAPQRRAHGDHAAADVDTHRRGNDRAIGRQHRADRRALAVMAIRHYRDVLEHEGHPCRVRNLLPCLRLNAVPR